MFDTFQSRYIFRGKLIAESGLHIGGGRDSAALSSDSPVIKDWDGFPFIPGSSFKGVLRSNLESLIRGLQHKELWSCDQVSGTPCISNKRREELLAKAAKNKQEQKPDTFAEDIESESCGTCKLFGSPLMASKVYIKDIKDMRVDREHFARIEVRDYVAIDRDTLTAKDAGKFDAEVVPVGSQFDLEIVVENPEQYELGLLFTGFEMFNEGLAMLGGKTSRGLGRVKIELSSVEELNPKSFLGEGKTIYRASSLSEKKSEESAEPETPPEPELIKPEDDDPWKMVQYVITRLENEGKKTDSGNIGTALSDDFELTKEARRIRKLPEKTGEFLEIFIQEGKVEKMPDRTFKLSKPADISPESSDPEPDTSTVEKNNDVVKTIDDLTKRAKDALIKYLENDLEKEDSDAQDAN